MGFQPLTMDPRSNPTPEGFEPLTKSSRSNSTTNCTLWRHYIRVIGEVGDYYGVHEIIAFDVRPVSSGNKVTPHFLEVAYSFEKTLEYAEDEMLRAVLLE